MHLTNGSSSLKRDSFKTLYDLREMGTENKKLLPVIVLSLQRCLVVDFFFVIHDRRLTDTFYIFFLSLELNKKKIDFMSVHKKKIHFD